MTVTKKAYAKINLTLEILGTKRGDGFHDIASVMMKSKKLYDEVTVTLTDYISVKCDTEVCDEKDNLAYKAAEKCILLCKEKYGKSFGASVYIKKNIPMGAGLAGGSSDAAAVIDAISELAGCMTGEEKQIIAESLGSDIPFCLECHNVALCKGRGEIITDLPDVEGVEVKIIKPKTPLFTKGIYSEYDNENGDDYSKDKSLRMAELIRKKADVSEIFALMCNDFQSICERRCPEIKQTAEQLRAEGYHSQMSGSGSAVFGIRKSV